MGISVSKEVIARQNQDGTVIVMRLDESSMFFKITGTAAQAWDLMRIPRAGEVVLTYSELLQQLTNKNSELADQIEKNLPGFLTDLVSKKLIEVSQESIPAVQTMTADSAFGGVKEFNLEQIETEVLNESVYLDVFAGSDLRLKTDVRPLPKTLEQLNKIEAVMYKWNPETVSADVDFSKDHPGVIAQQVAEVFPELVRKDSETGILAVNYSKLVSHLIVAVQELSERLNQLEKRIAQSESK